MKIQSVYKFPLRIILGIIDTFAMFFTIASRGREVELQTRQRRRLLGNLPIQQHAQPLAARLRPLRATGSQNTEMFL